MTKIVTKSNLTTMLNDASPEKQAQIIGRACWALFLRQTAAEQASNDTVEHNTIGFSGSDGKSGSLTAKYWRKHGTLAEWQVERWTRDWRGAPRIVKYWKQLNEIAVQKQAAA